MADIFLSYSRTDKALAEPLVAAMEAKGWSVWWDMDLAPGSDFDQITSEALETAKAVIVVWTPTSVESRWVRGEARVGADRGVLVPVRFDGAKLPIDVRAIHTTDLDGWAGDSRSSAFRTLEQSLAAMLDTSALIPAASAPPPAPAKPPEPLLAVLPFDNLSGDGEMLYFSDGVSEEILQTVARSTQLKVIGRGSSFQFRGPDKTAAHVAASLKATHLLDGSVRRSGNRVRISTHLIECAGATTLWSDRFDRDLTDIFALQDEIAAAVAEALKIAFGPAPPVGKVDPAAYDLYLRARGSVGWAANDGGDPVEVLEQVVARVPTLAPAWASLALARAMRLRRSPGALGSRALRAGVVEAAETALRLDPGCGLACVAQSYLLPWGRYAEQEALTAKALALAPNDPLIVQAMGTFLQVVGRNREAFVHYARAHDLDPLHPDIGLMYAMWIDQREGGRPEDLLDAALMLRAKGPSSAILDAVCLNTAANLGEWECYDDVARSLDPAFRSSPDVRVALAANRMLRRQTDEDRKVMVDLIEARLARGEPLETADVGHAYRIGARDEAFDAIDRASFDHMFTEDGAMPAGQLYSPGVIFHAPAFQVFMDDIRFVGLCHKLGLVAYWIETDRWPDCAETVPYDFKAEARRLATG